MYAHTLTDLQVPDEGKDGAFPWKKVWQKGLVHLWYGQPEMPNVFRHLVRAYVAHHLHHHEEVPEWAIAANAWFNGMPPPWPPKDWDFNLAYDIEQLRIKRGGKLPPGVRPLSNYMKNQLWNLANRPIGKGKGGPEAVPSTAAVPPTASSSAPAAAPKAAKPPPPASSEAPEAGASMSAATVQPEAVPSTAAVPPTALSSAPAAAPKAAKPPPPYPAVPPEAVPPTALSSAPAAVPLVPPPPYPPPPPGYPGPGHQEPPPLPPKHPSPGQPEPESPLPPLPPLAILDREPTPKSWDQDPRRSPMGVCWSKPHPSGAPNVASVNDMD